MFEGYARSCSIVIISYLLLSIAGCENTRQDEALDDGERAKASLATTRIELGNAKKKIVELEDMLDAMMHSKEETDSKITQFAAERDKAVTECAEAQNTVAALTAKLSQKTEAEAFLRNETKEWEGIVVNLQTTIAEQQATIEALQEALEQPIVGTLQETAPETEETVDPSEEPEEI